jgi:hypothetical protein
MDRILDPLFRAEIHQGAVGLIDLSGNVFETRNVRLLRPLIDILFLPRTSK